MVAIKPAPAGADKTLTPGEIANWVKSIFPAGEQETAVAVALGESGGRVAVVSPMNSNGTKDYGLFQINSVHEDLFEKYSAWWSVENVKMAKAVYDRQGWNAWTVYKSGAYKDHLDEAKTGVADPTEATVSAEDSGATQEAEWFRELKQVIAAIANGIVTIAQAWYKMVQWSVDPHNWVRAAIFALGGSLAIGGLIVAVKPNTNPVSAVTAAPRKAAKVAAVPVKVATGAVRTVV